MLKDKKKNKKDLSQGDNPLSNKSNNSTQSNECPIKDEDGNCIVPGVYSDSDPIGGG